VDPRRGKPFREKKANSSLIVKKTLGGGEEKSSVAESTLRNRKGLVIKLTRVNVSCGKKGEVNTPSERNPLMSKGAKGKWGVAQGV